VARKVDFSMRWEAQPDFTSVFIDSCSFYLGLCS
jgi:hypothetical protein